MGKSTKCRVGDLAVVVNAQLRCNIGNIVRVIAPDDGTSVCVFKGQGHIWTVTCNRPMTWIEKGKRYRSKTGPVPDNRLQPIRGATPGRHDDQAVELGVESAIGE